MQITTTVATTLKPKPEADQLGFGTVFTDHMFNLDFHPDKGWHHARIEPYADLHLDPATMVLHYGQGIFEGLKAYRTPEDRVQLFRPRDNFARLNASAKGMCIPPLDVEEGLAALKALLAVEREWVPDAPGTSLYIRPTVIATDPYLGVRASHTYRFFIILSPVGAYYAAGFNPVKIWVTRDHVRAVRGGLGYAKTMGNYAASLYAGEEATKAGYAQVLWLDGVSQEYVEEVGSMNIFFVLDGELVTPALNGSILPGITRDSVMALGRRWGMPVSERRVGIEDVFAAHAAGRLGECFGAGTAAVISPVGEIKFGDRVITIADGKVGPVARRFYDGLTAIQYGRAADEMGWIEPLDA